MRRRITAAILAVAALILVGLGLPLAVVEQHAIQRAELIRLEASATNILGEIDLPLHTDQLRTVGAEPDAPVHLAVYDAQGALLYGSGPNEPDAPVLLAFAGSTTSSTRGELVVAAPILDDQEQVVGAVRVSDSLGPSRSRAYRAWLVMAAAAAGALALGWLVARRVAATISAPVTDIADIAVASTGGGGATYPRSGIAEVDHLAEALERSSRRVDESLQRERRFSSDVSHQLRTPLAALRLRLERTGATGAALDTTAALADLDRIAATVEHLLALSRDAVPPAAVTEVAPALRHAVDRWSGPAQVAGRRIEAEVGPSPGPVAMSAVALDQILDVLIDNALIHGVGTVTVRLRELAGGTAVDVADEGTCRPDTAQRIFERREGEGTGIGLDLARTLAEADGARLTLSRLSPTTFSVVFLDPPA